MQFIQVKEKFNQLGINTFDRHPKGGYTWQYQGNQYRRCNLNDCLQWINYKQQQKQEQNAVEVNREGFWYFAKQQQKRGSWKLYKIPCSVIPDPGFLGDTPDESQIEEYLYCWLHCSAAIDRWIDNAKPHSIICEEASQEINPAVALIPVLTAV